MSISGSLKRSHSIYSPVTERRATLAVLALVGLVAFFVRAWLLTLFPFDGLYGQDAYFYLSATEGLVKVWSDPERFGQWLTVWGTPPISIWPLGYHAQMALASLFTGAECNFRTSR